MTTTDTIRAQSHKDPEQLEREIDHQRDHIAGIIRALEQRLSPGELFSSAVSGSKDGGKEFARNLTDTVKANPVPALLTVAGMAWLYAGQRNPKPAAAGTADSHRMADAVDHTRERIGDAKERMGHARERMGEKAHGAMDSVRDGSRRAGERMHGMLDENPMAVGAMAIAAGALLGAMFPSTRREDELMGRTRDRVADRARDVVSRGMEEAGRAGREVTTPAGSRGNGDGAPRAH